MLFKTLQNQQFLLLYVLHSSFTFITRNSPCKYLPNILYNGNLTFKSYSSIMI